MRVAIVGVWHVHAAEYVEELLETDGVTVVGVYDDDRTRAERFAAGYGLPVLPTLASALGPDTDAVAITTETAAHPRVIRAALEAGKHVFTEKVLTADPTSSAELQQLAAVMGRVLFVSLQRLAEPWLHTMLEVVSSGRLGRITATRLRYQHGGAVRGWLPDGFLRPDEAGGGSIIDLGAHGYYLSLLLHDGYPEVVTAVASAVTNRAVEDQSTVTLTYHDGSMSVLETSLVNGPYSRWWGVYGTDGFAVIDSRDDIVQICTEHDPTWQLVPNGPAHPSAVRRFLDAVAAGETDEENAAAALRLSALVADSYRSAAEGWTVPTKDPVQSRA